MSNTWKRAAVALQLGFLGVILFVSAACAAVSTPAPSNTPGTEVTVRAGSKVGRLADGTQGQWDGYADAYPRTQSQWDGYADAYPRTQGRV